MTRRCGNFSLLTALFLLTYCVVWQTCVIVNSIEKASIDNKSLEDLFLAPFMTITAEQLDFSTESVNHKQQRHSHPDRLLIIAAVPRDERHVWTLWSELECMTKSFQHVIISAPQWSRNITDTIVKEARTRIPRFVARDTNNDQTAATATTTIEAQYYVNDRYDVGLWCDALHHKVLMVDDGHGNTIEDYDEIGLLNDSVFALREYTAIMDALKERNVSMTSLSYSFSPANFKGKPGKEHFWVESIFRGFNQRGIQRYQNHSCLPASHHKFCRGYPAAHQKACIINNFEHDLTRHHFPYGDAYGLFESDAPPETRVRPYKAKMTWASNYLYWQKLVQDHSFPLAKENVPNSIPDLDSPLLANCTRYLTREQVQSWNFNFSVAETGFVVIYEENKRRNLLDKLAENY